MKSLIALWCIVLFSPIFADANPSPFGLKIGETTIRELKTKYKTKYAGINKYSNGEMYDINTASISLEGLKGCRAVFSKEGKLHALLCTLDKNRFDYIFNLLKGKYKIVSSNLPFVGDKSATFQEGNTEIILDAPHLSFTMDMNYIHKDLMDAYKDISTRQQQKKRLEDSSKL